MGATELEVSLPLHMCLVQVAETSCGAAQLALHRLQVPARQGLVQQHHSRQHLHSNREFLMCQVLLQENTR